MKSALDSLMKLNMENKQIQARQKDLEGGFESQIARARQEIAEADLRIAELKSERNDLQQHLKAARLAQKKGTTVEYTLGGKQ